MVKFVDCYVIEVVVFVVEIVSDVGSYDDVG